MRYGDQRKIQVQNLKKMWRKYALISPKIKILKIRQDGHYPQIYLHQTVQYHDKRISHLWDVATNGKHKSKIWRKFEENMPLFRLKSKFWKSDKTGIILGYIFIKLCDIMRIGSAICEILRPTDLWRTDGHTDGHRRFYNSPYGSRPTGE